MSCLYGCADPVACEFPHTGCHHCAAARLDALKHALAREFTYTGPDDYQTARAIVDRVFAEARREP